VEGRDTTARAVGRYCTKTLCSGPGYGDEKCRKVWTFLGMNGTGRRKRRRGRPRPHPKTRCHRNPRQRGGEVRQCFRVICGCRTTGSRLLHGPSPELRYPRPFSAAWCAGRRVRNESSRRSWNVVDEGGKLAIRSPPETQAKVNLTTVDIQDLKSSCPSTVSRSGVLGEHMQTWPCCQLQPLPHPRKISTVPPVVAFQTAYR
jgi:hypothetical protein